MGRKGPFGLWMGMTLDEANITRGQVAPGKYRAISVPRPHSAFETYILQISPLHGLSWIKAIGKSVPTSVYGIELKAAFDSMAQKLTTTYGEHRRIDFLMQDSIWNEPKDWMQSLLNRERVLMAEWSLAQASTLIDSLISVALVIGVQGTTEGYVAVEYSFENIKAAEAELAAGEDEAL